MRVLSLFTGVGGFDIGLENAGMTTVFQCEIDKHCQSVLRHRWPDVPKWDDVTTLTGRHIIDTVGQVDVVAWGSPCQDLSVAGRRAGLAGERSGLFHQGIRIIKELREITNGQSPTWSVWENVYGALSSNGGADFGEVLWEMDEAGACFSEWAVLDAQYFGVPQRRRRVFVASCFDSGTAERCPSPLFPVAESGAGDSSKSRKKRKGTSFEVASSVGEFGAIPIQDGREINKNQNGFGVGSENDPSYTLDQTGAQSVAYPIQGTVIGRSDTAGPQGRGFGEIDDPMYTLDSVSLHGVAQVFEDDRRTGPRFHDDVAPTLQSFMGTGGNNTPMVAQDCIGFSHTQGLDPQASEVHTPTLRRGGGGVAVAFTLGSIGGYVDGIDTLRASGGDLGGGGRDIVGPLAARDYKGVGNQYVMENKLVVHEVSSAEPSTEAFPILRTEGNGMAVAQEPLQIDGSPIAATLRGFGHGWQGQHNTTNSVVSDMVVRRLTPVECERLMGWPDNHTAVGINGPVKDTNRYKMCGNGVASPVAAWIGKHLMRTRPNTEQQSFMEHYLDQLEWERSNPDTPMLNG